MFQGTRIIPLLIAGFALLVGVQSPAKAGPCATTATTGDSNDAHKTITVAPLLGTSQTYCQSAFGWSDTWYPTSKPNIYSASLDVLSGDNAPDLVYTTANGIVRSGDPATNPYNVIGPWLDAAQSPQTSPPTAAFVGSNWSVVKDKDLTVNPDGNVGTSTITLGGLDAKITTTVLDPTGLTEAFSFTNNTNTAIDHLYFSDFFNYHANGVAKAADLACPTTSFDGTTVTTMAGTAAGCSPTVSDGTMFGTANGTDPATPLAWDLGLVSDVLAAMAAAGNADFSGFNSDPGPLTGNVAVDVVWDLGPLDVGASVDFTIVKNIPSLPPGGPPPLIVTPEPASAALLGTGLLGLALMRRRRKNVVNDAEV